MSQWEDRRVAVLRWLAEAGYVVASESGSYESGEQPGLVVEIPPEALRDSWQELVDSAFEIWGPGEEVEQVSKLISVHLQESVDKASDDMSRLDYAYGGFVPDRRTG